MPPWVANYIGLPFAERGRGPDGYDCWGLVRLIFEQQFGILLPSYTEGYRTTIDALEIGSLVRQESRDLWQAIRPTDCRLGDVIVLRVRGQPMHCGVVLEPPWMIHIQQGFDSVLDRWDAPRWQRRIAGCYRHPEMPAGLSS